MNRVWLLVGIGVALFAALLFWLSDLRPQALDSRDSQISMVHGLLLLVLVGSAFLVRWRVQSLGQWGRYALVWIGIALVLVVGYSYRADIERVWSRSLAGLMPGHPVEVTPGTVIVTAGEDRHFWLDATVDGASLHFLVDTGATNVVLNRQDARRIGLAVDSLSFTQRTETANGIGFGAPIRLREIRVGPIVVRDVRALVNKAPMSSSLLGIEFLERLSGYSVKDGTLTLQR
jgi:aspartyl protease family protein